MIKGRCHTNLDDYDCSLVKVFAEIPKHGDRVYVKRLNSTSNIELTLKVCGITHGVKDNEPYIEVELNR